MDYFQPRTLKHPQKFNNKRLTQDQVKLLETSFSFNNKLDSDRKSQLAHELGLPPRQIAIWYQNKRARWKNQSHEAECKTLQKRLESVILDNERLGREVERLKQELNKAREMLNNEGNYHSFVPSLSTSCDEVGSSSLIHGARSDHLEKDLFACIFGAQGRFEKPDDDLFSPSRY